MYAKIQQQKAEHIDQVVALCAEKFPKKVAAELESFIRQYFHRIPPEDALPISVANLYGLTVSLWKFGAERVPGEPKIRVYNPRIEEHGYKSSHTVIEIINDDMPFLVDSVTQGLAFSGYAIRTVAHPVFRVTRKADGARIAVLPAGKQAAKRAAKAIDESVLHVEINAQSDPDVLAGIEQRLRDVLADVRVVVADWRAMLAKVDGIVAELEASPPPLDPAEVAEGTALLTWMANNHFTLLGYREYNYERVKDEERWDIVDGTGLGILRDQTRRMMARQHDEAMSPEVREFLHKPELIIVTKANARSTVHRTVYLDYIGVKKFGAGGKVVGERRFIGLFTSAAYNRSVREIPFVRRKVARSLEQAGFGPSSHDGKAMLNILETFPRDELFQIPEEALLETVMGIVALQERPRIRLFVRRDRFERFVSCQIYVPRERYNTELRQKFGEILKTEFNGRVSAFYTQVGDEPLARIHMIIGLSPGEARSPEVVEVEQKLIQAARAWQDDMSDALIERWGEEAGLPLFEKYVNAFPTAYKEAFNAQMALFDIDKIESLKGEETVAVNVYRLIEDDERSVRFKIYRPAKPVALSHILPMLEHMGLHVIEEHTYEVGSVVGETLCWIHDFHMTAPELGAFDIGAVKAKFEQAFHQVWSGEMEDDGFNQLVITAGLMPRQVVVLRAYCKYLRQTGITFSQDYMEATLARNSDITVALVRLFEALFDPDLEGDRDGRAATAIAAIVGGLNEVASLDEDRILRRFLNLIQCTLRTNYYQHEAGEAPKPYLAFKFDSQRVDALPLPRPYREISVYSPRFEGVHLRGGPVARGGLRWSDRPEDFRTEILGLVKAQMVKNAVIVPVGSKGGFVPKRMPKTADREAILAEGVACYKLFISALLDITDNIVAGGIAAPRRVLRRDGDDPYLVVAADKGTATFSDIANDVALSYGFWLGDAFASGGASGYDHKKMAITARGAWECVKRHFRELGRDIQSEPFTAAGCGDMSGDVFGNGMLLSRRTRLIAAFDHRHIFIDPDPDPETSWRERQRLFDLPRSSWRDYDAGLLSKGGAVHDRGAKSIDLSAEARQALRIEAESLAPNELITAILKTPVDLLWFGGIGTYIKAGDESQADAGDRANDAVRVNAAELCCKVIGEGANLGVTQRGRIEFALRGGRVNTDFVDNSAGVDCSDHEVNIKILLGAVVADGEMTMKQRDRLLAEMTDEIAGLVLHDNYLQSQAISATESRGAAVVEPIARFMRMLERAGQLNRAIEFLPDDETLTERQAANLGLTRPELATVLAYAKMVLYEELLKGDLPDDPYLASDLAKYFPKPLRKRFQAGIERHQLRREIIATSVANSIVNRAGISYVRELQDELDVPASDIARAYAVTREVLDLRDLWTAIEALDNRVPAATQIEMQVMCEGLVRWATAWFVRNLPRPLDVAATIDRFHPGLRQLGVRLGDLLRDLEAEAYRNRIAHLVEREVPEDLARRVAALEPLAAALDIVQAAERAQADVDAVAEVYFSIGAKLGLDWLRVQAERMPAENHWERTAITEIVDDLYTQQRTLTHQVLTCASGAGPEAAVESWSAERANGVARALQLVSDLKASGGLDIPKLAIANRHVQQLIVG